MAPILIPWVASFIGNLVDDIEKETYGTIPPDSVYTPSGNEIRCGYLCIGSALIFLFHILFCYHVWNWLRRLAYVVVVGSRVRKHIRQQHAIPIGCGDCEVLFCVPSCGLIQMARHKVGEEDVQMA